MNLDAIDLLSQYELQFTIETAAQLYFVKSYDDLNAGQKAYVFEKYHIVSDRGLLRLWRDLDHTHRNRLFAMIDMGLVLG